MYTRSRQYVTKGLDTLYNLSMNLASSISSGGVYHMSEWLHCWPIGRPTVADNWTRNWFSRSPSAPSSWRRIIMQKVVRRVA